jgi:alpha-beta hydrolase superfamily lysophospholipase
MSFLSGIRPPLALGLGLAVAALSGSAAGVAGAREEKKADFKRVPFRTSDGVELQGTFYPGPTGKRDACVLLLHNVDMRKGGSSHQDGWDHLAEGLQKDGYAVLSFDFRGFGESKGVGKEFWDARKNPHNQMLKGARKQPDSIDQKDFPVNYYPLLTTDIAAAKAFLDRKNDAGEVNTSNLIVIGAGEGATLGALWMASEWKRHKAQPAAVFGQPPMMDAKSEGEDQACAVWLGIRPGLATRLLPVRNWVVEVGRDHRVPMAFVFGENDGPAKTLAENYLSAIKVKKADKNLELTGPKKISDTKLAGSQLLEKSLDTEKWIIKDYLDRVMEKRGSRERRKRETERFAYYWVLGRRNLTAKLPGEEAPRPIPADVWSR